MALKLGSTIQQLSDKIGASTLPNYRKTALEAKRLAIDIRDVNPDQTTPLMDRIANTASVSTAGRSLGRCLGFVRQALDNFGIGNQTRSATAIGSVDRFRQNPHFVEVNNVTRDTLSRLPRGTVVITRNPRGGAGHAQIMLGGGKAASDFLHGLAVYRGATEFYAFIPQKGFDGEAHGILTEAYGANQIDTKWGTIYSKVEDKPEILKFIADFSRSQPMENSKGDEAPKFQDLIALPKRGLISAATNQPVQSASSSKPNLALEEKATDGKVAKKESEIISEALSELSTAAERGRKKKREEDVFPSKPLLKC